MGQVVLLRHGQTHVNRWGAEELTPLGWEQSRLLGMALRDRGLAPAVVASGTARCHLESLEGIGEAAEWGDPAGLLDSGWDEFDHDVLMQLLPAPAGDSEPSPAELQAWFEHAAQRWTNGATAPGESFREFMTRVATAMAELMEATGPRDTAVVITSGGPIAAIAATLLLPDAGGELWCRLNGVVVHGSSSTVSIGPRGAALLSFNEHSHLRSR